VSPEQAILFLCERSVMAGGTVADEGEGAATDAATADDVKTCQVVSGADPRARAASRYPTRVVYQRCPDCERSRMATTDGFVEVGADELDRHEGCAQPIVIDGPTPPAMRRRILAREGERCGNPLCHHRADHCHHIVFRSRGGATDPSNEIGVCTTCHALIHAGLLRVTRRADGELTWSPASVGNGVGAPARSDRDAAARLPVLHLETPVTSRSGASGTVPASTRVDSASNVDDLASGLVRLGFTATRSRELIVDAIESLAPAERTEASVLRGAIAASGRVPDTRRS
jgi:hypothetical protein